MQAIQSPSLADQVRTLSAKDAGRDRQLHRLIDLHAATEALEALRAAGARGGEGILPKALASAVGLLEGGSEDAVALDRLRIAVSSPQFLALVPGLVDELRQAASLRPDTGACTVASALELWLWTMKHFRLAEMASAVEELSELVAPLLAARCIALTAGDPAFSDAELRADLSHVYAARTSSSAAATCAELVFGYRRHLSWDAEGCATCYAGDEVDDLEAMLPGIASGARMKAAVVEADGSHAAKAGPCARFDGVETFMGLRNRLDGCLTGGRLAKDRAVASITRSTTPATPEGNT
ncbi:MAG: hypothetical protein WA208_03275 [Thermoanaerobaculia bacterium]